MKIGIDIDDVLCQFFQGYLDFAKERLGDKKISDWIHEHVWEVFPLTKEEALKIADDFSFSEDFAKMKLVEGSKEAIDYLNKNYEIVFITARPSYLSDITEDFILKNYNLGAPKIIYAGNVRGGAKFKHEICMEEQINVIVEDSPSNAISCAKSGIKVILLDNYWNKKAEHENIFRVNGWKGALEVINGKL